MKLSIQPLFYALSVVVIGSFAACTTTKTVLIDETTTTVSRPSSKPKSKPADPGVDLEPVRKPATFSPSY